jgi:hypothetical protein
MPFRFEHWRFLVDKAMDPSVHREGNRCLLDKLVWHQRDNKTLEDIHRFQQDPHCLQDNTYSQNRVAGWWSFSCSFHSPQFPGGNTYQQDKVPVFWAWNYFPSNQTHNPLLQDPPYRDIQDMRHRDKTCLSKEWKESLLPMEVDGARPKT